MITETTSPLRAPEWAAKLGILLPPFALRRVWRQQRETMSADAEQRRSANQRKFRTFLLRHPNTPTDVVDGLARDMLAMPARSKGGSVIPSWWNTDRDEAALLLVHRNLSPDVREFYSEVCFAAVTKEPLRRRTDREVSDRALMSAIRLVVVRYADCFTSEFRHAVALTQSPFEDG